MAKTKISVNSLQCGLCPKNCVINPGQSGDCRTRVNLDGELLAITYGFPCSVHVDPIEKKPLYHFYPSSSALSIATVGCNLHCKNCQNWEISQAAPDNVSAYNIPPEQLPKMAKMYNCKSLSYTYTDPVVFYEYALDASIRAHEEGLKTVLVTAGYINPGPFRELCLHIDAVQIDIKAFSDKFYQEFCGATLAPVLNSLILAKSMGVMVEVSNLLIPPLNDSDDKINSLCKWVKEYMGKDTPLHFLRFFPYYQMRNLPMTPLASLEKARDIAKNVGLDFVYIGNVVGQEDLGNTYCPGCGKRLISRVHFEVKENFIVHGRCPNCQKEIYGKWN